MEFLSAVENLTGKLNSLVYSKPGGGKTTFGLQHPGAVIVDPGEQGYLTVTEFGRDFPVIQVKSLDDIEEVVYYPDSIMTKLKEAVPKFKDYEYHTFVFENINYVQELFLGQASKTDPDTKAVIRPATGIMKLPHSRKVPGTPEIKDWGVLSRLTKGFFKGVRNMPFHTVMTVHAGLSETEESPKGIDVPASEKDFAGFPDVYGQMKYKAGGLADFYFYLKRVKRGGKLQYMAYTVPDGKFEGRSKIASRLPGEIDWSNKNIYDIVQGHLTKALEEIK